MPGGDALPAGEALGVIAAGASISTLLLLASVPLVIVLAADRIGLSFTMRGLLYVAAAAGVIFLTVVIYSLYSREHLDAAILARSPRRFRASPRYRRVAAGLAKEAEGFGNSIRSMLGMGPLRLALAFLYTLLFWITGFMVIPVVLAGMGYPHLFWDAAVAQMVVYALLPFIPIPGAGGAGEAGFAAVFVNVVPSFLVGLLAVAWRFLDFYMSLATGGVALLAVARDLRRHDDGPAPESEAAAET